MCGIIYKATNLINGKIYIGQTISKIEVRIRNHCSDAKKNKYNSAFHRAINKYGIDNFNIEVIDKAKDKETLNEKEIYWINHYNSYIRNKNSNGYNLTLGGDGSNGLKGELSTNPKLNNKDIKGIKKLIIEGLSDIQISKIYNISRERVGNIRNNKAWVHVFVSGWEGYVLKSKPRKVLVEDIIKIKKLLINNESVTNISEKLNIPIHTVYNVSSSDIGNNVSVEGWELYIKQKKNTGKLSYDKVIEIKQMLISGHENTEISNILNIKIGTIRRIATGTFYNYILIDGWEEWLKNKKPYFLEDKIILDIRKRLMSGEKQKVLATQYGISKHTMCNIASIKNYKKLLPTGYKEWLKIKKGDGSEKKQR